MTQPPLAGKRGRCVNCWPFRETPATHVVKIAAVPTTSSMSGRPVPASRVHLCGAHARQLARFQVSVGRWARAYRYRRIRGTQPHPTPPVLLSGY